MSYEFKAWPKIPRLNKMVCSITEKLDGTNAIVAIEPINVDVAEATAMPVVNGQQWAVFAGSRTRWIQPGNDNFGFAAWVEKNAEHLVRELGVGRHYGEWWGQGIQRQYGLTKKYFTLFNPWRYGRGMNPAIPTAAEQISRDTLLGCVPTLSLVQYSPSDVSLVELKLMNEGSVAVPGWMKPEGFVIHIGGETYKVVLHGDENKREG